MSRGHRRPSSPASATDGEIAGVYRDAQGITHGVLLDKKGNFITIDAPDAVETAFLDINNRGQIIGGSADAGGAITYFLLEDRVFTPIAVPGASFTVGIDINNHGQKVGAYRDAAGGLHGFLMDRGVFTTVEPPGAGEATAIDINDRGQIVGIFRRPGDVP
jgi:uncharacterized membrane protein